MQHLQHREYEALDKDRFDDIVASLIQLRSATCYPVISTLIQRLFDFYVNYLRESGSTSLHELRDYQLSVNYSNDENVIWLTYYVEDIIEIEFKFQPVFIIKRPLLSYGSVAKQVCSLIDLQTKTKYDEDDYRVSAVKYLLEQFALSETLKFKIDSGDTDGRLEVSLTLAQVGYTIEINLVY